MDRQSYEAYLSRICKEENLSDESTFSDYLKRYPKKLNEIIENSEGVFWLHFEYHTYDGWYCDRDDSAKIFYVFFQEHRRRCYENADYNFENYEEAVTRVLTCHGVLKF